jgi:putative PIN family toxin of toxin-antitoxin system
MNEMRIVLDTAAVVAAMRSPTGASAAILRAARQGRVTLLASVPLAIEYEAVCFRPEHRRDAGLTINQIDAFLHALLALTEPVRAHFLWRPQLRDPDDEMVLETAINGRADAVVTFNVRDYGIAPSQFGVEVLLPREAISRVKP